VNSAEDDIGAALTSQSSNLISTQGIPRVYTDAYDIATLDAAWIHRTEHFIDQYRVAERRGRGSRKHIEPARRDNGSAK
jgi:hypothetical protein